MIDYQKVEENLQAWLKNPYWKECYETAPSETAKWNVALEFYMSYNAMNDELYDEVADVIKENEEKFTIEDWKHQLKYNGNNPRVLYIQRKIKELEQKQCDKA